MMRSIWSMPRRPALEGESERENECNGGGHDHRRLLSIIRP
jgi:hypothetical protein